MSGSVIKTFADERLLASNLGISFFPRFRFGLAVKGNSIDILVFLASEPFFSIVTQCSSPLRCVTILKTAARETRHIQAPDDKISPT